MQDLPHDVLRYLLNSRYCEVDRLSNIATELFGGFTPGWVRVQAVCDWVHDRVRFGYEFANSTKTALDVFTDRCGVCRDFQHLAVTHLPGPEYSRPLRNRVSRRYRGAASPVPWISARGLKHIWIDRWWTFDARHNTPRIGRVLMAVGRDASDVAITTSFGMANLRKFTVVTDEVPGQEAAYA